MLVSQIGFTKQSYNIINSCPWLAIYLKAMFGRKQKIYTTKQWFIRQIDCRSAKLRSLGQNISTLETDYSVKCPQTRRYCSNINLSLLYLAIGAPGRPQNVSIYSSLKYSFQISLVSWGWEQNINRLSIVCIYHSAIQIIWSSKFHLHQSVKYHL